MTIKRNVDIRDIKAGQFIGIEQSDVFSNLYGLVLDVKVARRGHNDYVGIVTILGPRKVFVDKNTRVSLIRTPSYDEMVELLYPEARPIPEPVF